MLRMCELPPATETWTFENFDASGPLREAYEASLDIAEEKGNIRWLTLIGPVDTGKSHLAVAICRKWLSRGKPARYILTPLMLDNLRNGYNRGDYELQMKFLQEVPLLVMDDLGAERATEWAMEKLMILIDQRYVNGLYLVVTTNRFLDNIPGDIDHRIGSRLLRAPFSRVVVIDAPEYRTKRLKENKNRNF